jgi:uncharacterized protein
MVRISVDTNLFTYAADPDSPFHSKARAFFKANQADSPDTEFVTCELVLVELYMQLRNHAVSTALWRWAIDSTTGFRHIIDARLGLTLRHHGVTDFATANVKDFEQFGFARVWNPIKD